MKSFTSTLVLAASAAITTAQVITNPDGTFACPIPNAAYCAGDSLSTNIIIRCIGTVGQPGNCNDNLDGEPPFGLNFAPCWQPSASSGMAACSKNCIVYGGSGNYNGTFTLPNCTPTFTATTSTTSAVSSASATTSAISYTTIVTQGTTITVPCSSVTPTTTPSGTAPTTLISTITAPSGGASNSAGNGTLPTSTQSASGSVGSVSSATATPVGPTTTGPASFTGAAIANQAGVALAAGGLFMAYFL